MKRNNTQNCQKIVCLSCGSDHVLATQERDHIARRMLVTASLLLTVDVLCFMVSIRLLISSIDWSLDAPVLQSC